MTFRSFGKKKEENITCSGLNMCVRYEAVCERREREKHSVIEREREERERRET